MVSQQLLVNISNSLIIDFASVNVNHRVVTIAEVFLLTHITYVGLSLLLM